MTNKYPEYRMAKPISIWKPGNLLVLSSKLDRPPKHYLLILEVSEDPETRTQTSPFLRHEEPYLIIKALDENGQIVEQFRYSDIEDSPWELVEP
jgi:hypothetical protein